LLGQFEGADPIVIADFEAGVGTLTRLGAAAVDALVVVVEPTPKSIEVAQRAIAIAAERGIGPVTVVANKVGGDDDVGRLRAALGERAFSVVPEDPAILDADRDGHAPLDLSPHSPGVRAVASVARSLVATE
jgi:CO dehydrogenase maturation factor